MTPKQFIMILKNYSLKLPVTIKTKGINKSDLEEIARLIKKKK